MIRLLSFIGQTDSDIVPHFLDHYRRMGVAAFHVVLQGGWTEAELRPLRSADVTVVAHLASPFDDVEKAVTLDRLAKTFPGEWLIVADADEFLELPYASLGRTIQALQVLGLDELPGYLLQRLSADGSLDPLSELLPLDLQFPYFDFRLAERMGVPFPLWKAKYSLMRVGPNFRFQRGHHLPSAGRASAHLPIRGVLHHFKWRDRLRQSLGRQRVNSNQNEQDAYRAWLASNDSRLPIGGSALYSRAALFDAGHLIRPNRQELLAIAARRKAPARPGSIAVLERLPPTLPQEDKRAEALLDRKGLAAAPGRIALVTPALLGLSVTGGIGTAMTALAERLAAAGHEVHAFIVPYGETTVLAPAWKRYWQARGVHVHELPWRRGRRHVTRHEITLVVCEALQALGSWDVIHCAESAGLGTAIVLQRAAGQGFQDSQVVVTVHGPIRWHRAGNFLPWNDEEAEHTDLETQLIAGADALVFPSEYMMRWTERHFPSEAPRLLIPNGLIAENRLFGRASCERRRISSIVFFGRIEFRKGLDTFFEAIEHVLASGQSDFDVVFLGGMGHNHSEGALWKRVAGWSCRVRLISNYSSPDALEFLRTEPCVAVIPSRADNSPYTVYECLQNGIPFLASDVGGIPELVAEADRVRVLVAGTGEDYGARLLDALQNGMMPASPSFDHDRPDLDLLALHANLVVTARQERGRPRGADQRGSVSVVVHGGSDSYARLEPLLRRWARDGLDIRWVRGAGDGMLAPATQLNRLAGSLTSEILLFVHASVAPTADLLPAMLAALGDADAVVCGYSATDTAGEERAIAVFAGPPERSTSRNVYGSGVFLIRRERFLREGGFATEAELGDMLEWDLLNRLRALGGRIHAIPAPLAASARRPETRRPSHYQAGRLAEPWTRGLAEPMAGFLRMALHPQQPVPTGRGVPAPHPPAEADAAPLDTAGRWSDDNELGRLAIGGDGRLLDASSTYTIDAAEDAEGCDFLVADDVLDDHACGRIAAAFARVESCWADGKADRYFLRYEEFVARERLAAADLLAAVQRSAALTAAFHGLRKPLHPSQITLVRHRAGSFEIPARPVLPALASGAFAGRLCFQAAAGGDAYFPAPGIGVKQRAGRLIGAPASAPHECATLRVESGVLLTATFILRDHDAGSDEARPY